MQMETLRRRALRINARHNWSWKTWAQVRAFRQAENEPVHNLRQARVIRHMLEHYPVVIRGGDRIVGSLPVHPTPPEAEADLRDADSYLWQFKKGLPFGPGNGGVGGHRTVDLVSLLSEGVEGIRHRIDEAESALQDDDPETAEKRTFYQASRIALEGLMIWADRHRRECMRLAERRSGERDHWLDVADRFKRVPEYPPESFAQALQSVWTLQLALRVADDTSCAGRPDQYLLPFYEADLASGKLSRKEALGFIVDYYLRANEVFGRWPWTIMLGGRTPNGEAVENNLTHLFLEAIGVVGLVNPNVSLCVHSEMSDDLLLKGLALNGQGLSSPAYYNDNVITQGLELAGLQKPDASQYINSTCVEISPIGCSNVQVAVVHLFPAKTLNMMLFGGEEGVEDMRMHQRLGQDIIEGWKQAADRGGVVCDIESLQTFEAFKRQYFQALSHTMRDCVAWGQSLAWRTRQYGSCPLVSCFTRDCIARGKDAAAGGALANDMGTTVAGFSTAVDTLLAIRHAVYTDQKFTLSELIHLLKSNFQGYEAERQYLLNACPKYGNGDEDADTMAVELYTLMRDELAKYRTCLGGRFCLGIFSGWGQGDAPRGAHIMFGEGTGATADGRLARTPLSENIGPAPGADRRGPTATIQSVSRLDQRHALGGASVNMKFTPALFHSDETRQKILFLLREFIRSGGFELQFNVVDTELLREAQAEPERHRSLTVRIAGYSDYFATLERTQQNDIIERTQYAAI